MQLLDYLNGLIQRLLLSKENIAGF